MTANSQGVPTFSSALLSELAAAFTRRRKAIAYHAKELRITGQVERANDEDVERFNVDYLSVDRTDVRLSVWSDGMAFVRTCRPGPSRSGGWEFNVAIEADLVDVDCATIVALFESTIGLQNPVQSDVLRLWPVANAVS